jgi:hypothetical protein
MRLSARAWSAYAQAWGRCNLRIGGKPPGAECIEGEQIRRRPHLYRKARSVELGAGKWRCNASHPRCTISIGGDQECPCDSSTETYQMNATR